VVWQKALNTSPRVRDLLNPKDRNYVVQKDSSDDEVEVVDENVRDDSVNAVDMWDSGTPSSKKSIGMPGSIKGMSPSVSQGLASEHRQGGSPRTGGGQAVSPRISLILLSSLESWGLSGRP
jgi:hypothetical protein